VERKIQEFRDRNGQWKSWDSFDDLIMAGIQKIPIRDVPNRRMRVRVNGVKSQGKKPASGS